MSSSKIDASVRCRSSRAAALHGGDGFGTQGGAGRDVAFGAGPPPPHAATSNASAVATATVTDR